MRTDIRRYTAEAADAARSICVFIQGGRILVDEGPRYTPHPLPRHLHGAWATILRNGAVVPGVALSIVTLTGDPGSTWLLELDSDIQGSGVLVGLKRPQPVDYDVGVLVRIGTLAADDVVQMGCSYD